MQAANNPGQDTPTFIAQYITIISNGMTGVDRHRGCSTMPLETLKQLMQQQVENIKPYSEGGDKTGQVRHMFDSIAPAYDFMNRAMTLGIDKLWRMVARTIVAKTRPQLMLDVATGTGDFAIQLFEHIKPQALTGIDLSEGMLDVARQKVAKRHLQDKITFTQGDCLNLPYPDESFNAVTAAFGVRNFEHIDRGYSEIFRVLKPGGMVCIVELSTPTNPLVKWFYDLYTLHVIPAVGALKSGDRNAYRYLPQSIAAVPQGEEMLRLMGEAGFHDCAVRRLTFGVCSIYTAIR